jgi:L-seryl-tRNA(Ser) seleniumtransferase
MRVHPSNFVIWGFTEEVSFEELVALGRRHDLPVIDDIGSGALIDFAQFGLQGEPIAGESIKAGADLVLFSGDKLLGGPQSGVVVGRRKWIQQLAEHPLARALRVDKVTLAALAATLRSYRNLEEAKQTIPLLQLLSTSTENLQNRAQRLAPQLQAAAAIGSAEAVEGVTYLGGGAVPTQQLRTWCVALVPARLSVNALAHQLRVGTPSIFARIQNERLLLDLRTVFPQQDTQMVAAVQALRGEEEKSETPTQPQAS